MQPFACKLKAENISHSDDPSTGMIPALGSFDFTWKEEVSLHINGTYLFIFACLMSSPSQRPLFFIQAAGRWGVKSKHVDRGEKGK